MGVLDGTAVVVTAAAGRSLQRGLAEAIEPADVLDEVTPALQEPGPGVIEGLTLRMEAQNRSRQRGQVPVRAQDQAHGPQPRDGRRHRSTSVRWRKGPPKARALNPPPYSPPPAVRRPPAHRSDRPAPTMITAAAALGGRRSARPVDPLRSPSTVSPDRKGEGRCSCRLVTHPTHRAGVDSPLRSFSSALYHRRSGPCRLAGRRHPFWRRPHQLPPDTDGTTATTGSVRTSTTDDSVPSCHSISRARGADPNRERGPAEIPHSW